MICDATTSTRGVSGRSLPPDLTNKTPNSSQMKEEAAFKRVTLTSFVLNQLLVDFSADTNKDGSQTGQNVPDKSPVPRQQVS